MHCLEKFISVESLVAQIFWDRELGLEDGSGRPVYTEKFFQQMDRSKSQDLPNDTFFRRPIFKANCIIGIGRIR